MKERNRLLRSITLLLLTALLAAVPSANTYAEDAGESGNSGTSSTEGSPKKMYKTGVYRINDWGEVFKPEEKDQLDDLVCEQMEECHLDFPIILKATGSKSSEEYTDTFYAHNGLGWGDGKDGVMLVLYTDKEEVFAKGYGFGHWFLNKELNQKICTKLSLMQKENRSCRCWQKRLCFL